MEVTRGMRQVAICVAVILGVQSMGRCQLIITPSYRLAEQLAFKREIAAMKKMVVKYHVRSITLWGTDSGKTLEVSRWTFDSDGNMKSSSGLEKDTYNYNEWDMLIQRVELSDTNNPDEADVYKFGYNLGMLVSVEEEMNGSLISSSVFAYTKGRLDGSSILYNDGSGEYRLYKFSTGGSLLRETDVDRQAGKIDDYYIFKYDVSGNVTEEIHGDTTKYIHDHFGKRLSEIISGHNYVTGENITRIVYHYDKQGKPLDECWVNSKGKTTGREWFTYTYFHKDK